MMTNSNAHASSNPLELLLTADIGLGPRQKEFMQALSLIRAALRSTWNLPSTDGLMTLGICIRCLPQSRGYQKRKAEYMPSAQALFLDAIVDGDSALHSATADHLRQISRATLEAIQEAHSEATSRGIRFDLTAATSIFQQVFEMDPNT